MFYKSTKRARRAMRYTFHDAAMPPSARYQAPVATTTSYAPSAPSVTDSPEGDTVITLPPDWDQKDIVELLSRLVDLGEGQAYFGRVEPTPRHLGQVDPSEDQQPLYESKLAGDQATEGATIPPGMWTESLALYPLQGTRYTYVLAHDQDAVRIYRQTLGNNMKTGVGNPVMLMDAFEIAEGTYIWSDQTSTEFRVWRSKRKPELDLGDRPGVQDGFRKAAVSNDNANRIRQIAAANKALWERR